MINKIIQIPDNIYSRKIKIENETQKEVENMEKQLKRVKMDDPTRTEMKMRKKSGGSLCMFLNVPRSFIHQNILVVSGSLWTKFFFYFYIELKRYTKSI